MSDDVPPNIVAQFTLEDTTASSNDDNDEEVVEAVAVAPFVPQPVSALNNSVRSNKTGSTRPPKPPSRRAPAKKARGENFSQEELFCFLATVKRILPLGTYDWEVIAKQHHSNWPDKDRSAMSLKNKFAKMAQAKGQTGDPDCPPEVLLVYEINDLIRDKAELATTDILAEEDEDAEGANGNIDAGDRAAVLANIAAAPASLTAAVYSSLKKDRIISRLNKKQVAAASESFDLNQLIAQQMIQRENDREDDIRRREADDRRREADDRRRDLENQRREDANRAMMMQMMMFMHGGAGAVERAPPSLATIAPPIATIAPTSQEQDDNASVTSTQKKPAPPKQRRSPRHK
jgi:hypothetical protein